MSTGQIVAGVAAVAGMFVGIPPQYTYMAVSYLWSATHPNVIEGPALTDLSVITAQAGGVINRVFGSARLSGNVIYSQPLTDIPETVSAKGASAEQKNHKYYATFAVAVGQGELDFGRVWVNKKLHTTNSANASVEDLLISSKKQGTIRFYRGTRDQRPDPVIQADQGWKASAYRGTAYVMFDMLPYDGSLAIEIEVIKDGQVVYVVEKIFTVDDSAMWLVQGAIYPSVNQKNQLVYITGFNNAEDQLAGKTLKTCNIITTDGALKQISAFGTLGGASSSFSTRTKSTDGSTLLVVSEEITYIRKYYCAFSDGAAVHLPINDDLFIYDAISVKDSQYMFLARYDKSGNRRIHQVSFNGIAVKSVLTIDAGFNIRDMALGSNYLYVLDNLERIHYFDVDDLEYKGILFQNTTSNTSISALTTDSDICYFVIGSQNPSLKNNIYKVKDGTQILEANIASGNFAPNKLFYTNSNFYGTSINITERSLYIAAKTVASKDIEVSSIVKSLCLEAGVAEDEIVVDSLKGIKCRGYVLANIMTAGSAIEQLANYFFFDIVESDDKLKYIKRGNPPVARIPEDDLAAHVDGSDLPDDLESTRQPSLELPNKVTLKYMDYEADYQVNSRVARRFTIKTQSSINPEVAVVMNATQAMTMANRILYCQWNDRTTYKLYLSIKYWYLEPTDVIEVERDGEYKTMRITEIGYQNGILTVSAVAEDSSIYDVVEVADSSNYRTTSLSYSSTTDLNLLDIPLLRDEDDANLINYMSANGLSPNGWGGAQVYKSLDGSSYATLNEYLTRGGIFGVAKNALADWKDNVPDFVNTLTVRMNGALNSTSEANFFSKANAILVGDEILQFQYAEAKGDNVFELKHLMRGRLGTERFKNTHRIGEKVVLLNMSGLYVINSSYSEIGQERVFKAVSNGETLDDALAVKFTNNAASKMPYSPCHLGGGRDGSGNLTLQWVRRTRINGGWNNKINVPLGETTELYEVDIIKPDGTVARTIENLTSPTCIYTAAQQVSDFGSVQSSVKFTVYQISSMVGRGFPATETI